MVEPQGGVILLILIVFILVLALVSLININTTKDLPKNYRNIIPSEKSTYNDIDTGDILIVAYQGMPNGWFIRIFTHSIWCHTGMAFRDSDGDLWVLEAANYSKERNGFFFVPFEIWVSINKNQSISYIKYNGPKINTNKVLEVYNEFKDIKVEGLNIGWLRFLQYDKYRHITADNKLFTCYELTITMLHRLAIIKKDIACSSYFPRDIAYRKFNTEEGVSYSELMGIRLITI